MKTPPYLIDNVEGAKAKILAYAQTAIRADSLDLSRDDLANDAQGPSLTANTSTAPQFSAPVLSRAASTSTNTLVSVWFSRLIPGCSTGGSYSVISRPVITR